VWDLTNFVERNDGMPLKIHKIMNDLWNVVTDTQNHRHSHAGIAPANAAREIYKLRRRRTELIDDEIFGEPAWDILLDLFEANSRGKVIGITSACIASAVPSTTALRWLNALIARGHVERYDDPHDGRRSFLRLTPGTMAKMHTLLSPDDRGGSSYASACQKRQGDECQSPGAM
jgi:DNA-binding MarR family transcriptional regulator